MNKYPVKVSMDGRIIRNCRLVVDEEVTRVWAWDKDQSEAFVLAEQAGSPTRVGATASFLVGDMTVDPQRGCGCSHPMHTWVPPTDVPRG